jgi:hypothetical protein
MRTYEELRGGHPPRDIYAELRRIEERGKRKKQSKLRILLNPRTGRKTITYPSETKTSPSETKRANTLPSETI